jgi:phosphoglycerate kinase
MVELNMFKTLDDINAKGKRVLLRGDLNVPMREGRVSDATRIDRLLPTIIELANSGAKVVIISHFGRPEGKIVAEMSLRPICEALQAALGSRKVVFAEDCIGGPARDVVDSLAPGDVALLENLRFHPGEEANESGFAQALAALGDIYVNDAFSAAHRSHASTAALVALLPSAAGRNMQAELEALSAALENPQRPVAAVVGGAKVSSKLDVLGHLVDKVDVLVIGGGMANTFLFSQGHEVGASLCEKDLAETARTILVKADAAGCDVVLPIDVVVAREFKEGAAATIVSAHVVPDDQMILDFGPESIAVIEARLKDCRTLVWNGPLGAFEIPPFDVATVTVAKAVAALSAKGNLTSVAGGGDTVAALAHAGASADFTYISTAGGAFLEWLEGKTLPGVAALSA